MLNGARGCYLPLIFPYGAIPHAALQLGCVPPRVGLIKRCMNLILHLHSTLAGPAVSHSQAADCGVVGGYGARRAATLVIDTFESGICLASQRLAVIRGPGCCRGKDGATPWCSVARLGDYGCDMPVVRWRVRKSGGGLIGGEG